VKIKPSDIFVTKEKSTYMHTINKAFKVYLNQLILIAALLICNSNQVLSQDVSAGEKLFKNNCAQCHKVTDQKLVGPGLKGVAARVPQPAEEWLIKWIKNSQTLVKAGDAYAVKIFDEYNKSVMPSQALSDDEIKSVLAYIANPPVDTKAAATVPAADNSAPTKTDSTTVLYFLFGLILLFLILISVLGGVRNSLQRLVNQKEGLPEPVPVSYDSAYFKNWARTNKKLVALGLIVIVSYGAKAAWYGMMGIGVYEGYAPEQPIFFSHKIHAGQNAINCVYCHSGVEKSKISNVPSANVCMNCHKGIQEGAVTGKKEIAKIYAALDYDPAKDTYGPNPKPIKWVKVHQLPEHAYFNHAQHVTVGKQECATCHGPVAEMDTLRQFTPLTMGWCIDCHRKTEVKMEGNPYYNKLHEELKKTYGKKPITVSMMGGIECGKCHY
jgi:mono/diheme cytochrome c family protein